MIGAGGFMQNPKRNEGQFDDLVIRAYEEIDSFDPLTVAHKTAFTNRVCEKYKVSKFDLMEYEKYLNPIDTVKHV